LFTLGILSRYDYFGYLTGNYVIFVDIDG
jgi:hypothetical protein